MGDDLVVTVIATGFEHDQEPVATAAATERASVRAPKPAQPVLAGAGVGVAAATDRSLKDLDRPAFLRRMSEARETIDRASLVPEDEWDVPTFLRKQAD
jgi:cell division protein FtsZ